jgi:hypothetical protein
MGRVLRCRGVKSATNRDVRNFGIVMLVAALVVSGSLHRRGFGLALVASVAAGGLLIALASIVAPSAVRPVHRGWMFVGHTLGRVTTPVEMAVLFFVVMVPIRALLAIFRRDPLDQRFDRTARTYWSDRRRPRFERADFERLG